MLKHGSRPVILLGVALAAVLGVFTAGANAESPRVNSAPTVTGIPMEGETLEGNNGSWFGDAPITYEYDWQRCNSGGGDCRNIGVPKSKTYVLTAADVGSRIRTIVTATNLDCGEVNRETGHQECRNVSVQAPSGITPVIQAAPGKVPSSTGLPTITGLAEEAETLTAADGTWGGAIPITTARQWQRCNAAGAGCASIPGATAATYELVTADVSQTIRVLVTATNERGSTSAASAQTAVVAPLRPRAGRLSIDVDRVALPHRLRIDRFTYSPQPVRGRTPVTVSFRVRDTRGFLIEGALVRVVGVPFNTITRVPEQSTGVDGTVTFELTPTARVRFASGESLFLYVRARKQGEKADLGVSTGRLVWMRLGAPLR